MRALWAKYKKVFLSVLLLAVPLLFYYVNAKSDRDLNLLDRFILQLSAPVQHATRWVVDGAFDLWEDYVYLRDLRATNAHLRRELARLGRVESKLAEAAAENARLRGMVDFHGRSPGIKKIAAKVIARSTSPYFRVYRIRVSAGSDAGIERGMPVVTGEGVVGRIHRVYGGYADVQLVADPESSIDVVVQGTRATGFLRGRGESNNYRCRLEHLTLADSVRDGDVIVTSGLGQGNRFPKGLVIGRVSHIIRKQFAIAQEVEVTPAVDFSKIEEVFVLKDGAGVFVPPPRNLVSPRGAAQTVHSAEMPAAPPPLKIGEDAAELAEKKLLGPAPTIDPREVQKTLQTSKTATPPKPQEVIPRDLALPPPREVEPEPQARPGDDADAPAIDLREINEAIREQRKKAPPPAEEVVPRGLGPRIEEE